MAFGATFLSTHSSVLSSEDTVHLHVAVTMWDFTCQMANRSIISALKRLNLGLIILPNDKYSLKMNVI